MSDAGDIPASRVPWALPGNLGLLALLVLGACLLLPLHDDAWWPAQPQPRRWWMAGLALVAYLAGCTLLLRRRRVVEAESIAGNGASPLLVTWASQTGFAQVLAERSAAMLRDAGVPVLALPLDAVDAALLGRTRRALFLASTTGEGDPPDHALAFLQRTMPQAPALAGLEYALLALGDREYQHFCAFGRQLDEWLRARGAMPLFDPVEVDNADEATLRHWQYEVGRIGGLTDLPDWSPPAYESWLLRSRSQVNAGSPGAPVFDLALEPLDGKLPDWQAGDIAEIGPRNPPDQVRELLAALQLAGDTVVQARNRHEPLAMLLARSRLPSVQAVQGLAAWELAERLQPLPHREYSIASIPAERAMRLLVRRMDGPDGRPGLGSGWLCDGAQPGQAIDLRLRRNPGFHPPPIDRPLVLVGNGTGIAGLRAHLQARIAAGAGGNWLLFGERSPDHDRPYAGEIRRWQAQGWLERVDLAFSRAVDRPEYVQHRLQAAADELVEWVDRGASILVCGSAAGMAPAVDAVLATVLGEARRDALRIEGRYRRDVY